MTSPVLHREVALRDEEFTVPRARHLTAALCLEWGLDALVDTASSVVTELVTNAVVHTHRPVELRLAVRDGRLRIEVTDSDDGPPARTRAPVDAPRGRGLRMVESLSETWGVEPHPVGKTVWAELAVPEG